MKRITLCDALTIIQKTFSSFGTKLYNHGEQTAYIVWKMLETKGGRSKEEILNISALCVFHDIGAYKIEERKRLVEFDLKSPHNHAIYGYLFVKYFCPLRDYAEILLYHHYYYADRFKAVTSQRVPSEALMLALADRISILFIQSYAYADIESFLKARTGSVFGREFVDLLLRADRQHHIFEAISSGKYLSELYGLFAGRYLNYEETVDYAKMLSFAIDFRSESTVIHTITVEKICRLIAEKYGLPEAHIKNLSIAATLHDIGKITVPVEILEKPGRLTGQEFDIMKSHVVTSGEILSGIGLDEIERIAVLHHEKLDGSGYPYGLKGDEIPLDVRICSVADIASALLQERSYKKALGREEITRIIYEMALENKIDPAISAVFLDNYDFITARAMQESRAQIKIYRNIKDEYRALQKSVYDVATNK